LPFHITLVLQPIPRDNSSHFLLKSVSHGANVDEKFAKKAKKARKSSGFGKKGGKSKNLVLGPPPQGVQP
jgi:hypothetical protein